MQKAHSLIAVTLLHRILLINHIIYLVTIKCTRLSESQQVTPTVDTRLRTDHARTHTHKHHAARSCSPFNQYVLNARAARRHVFKPKERIQEKSHSALYPTRTRAPVNGAEVSQQSRVISKTTMGIASHRIMVLFVEVQIRLRNPTSKNTAYTHSLIYSLTHSHSYFSPSDHVYHDVLDQIMLQLNAAPRRSESKILSCSPQELPHRPLRVR